jgi:hypothetical protein
MSLHHLRSHPVFDAQQLDDRRAVLGLPLVSLRDVAKAEVVELPQQLQIHIAAHSGAAAVGSGGVPSAGERAAGRRGRPAQQDVRQERPPALLFE